MKFYDGVLKEFVENVRTDFDKQLVSSRILLDRFRLNEESSRKTGAYQDPRYLPFYYHLAKFCSPKSLLEIGFHLGLASGCFLKRCSTVEKFLAFQQKDQDFYSSRLAQRNIKDVYKGNFDLYVGDITDIDFLGKMDGNWDMIFINEDISHDQHKIYLDLAWNHLSYSGLLVVDHVRVGNSAIYESFESFCRINNRTPDYFNTRYGTAIVCK